MWAWLSRSKQALTSAEVTERLAQVERALQLQYVHKPQSEVTLASGSAAAQLIAALEHTPQAVIQIGTLLLIKMTVDSAGSIYVRTLSEKELALLSAHPDLFASPARLLSMLAEADDRPYLPTVEGAK